MNDGRAGLPGDATAGAIASAVAAIQLLRVARGFNCVFWGIPLTLLLFFNAIRFPFWAAMPLPPYVLGVLVIYGGLILLHAAGRLTPRWAGLLRAGFAALFLHIYFAPFVCWWQRLPHVPFFLVNVICLFLCTMWLLLVINRLAGELACALDDTGFCLETEICGWSLILLLLLPFLAVFLFSLQAALRHQSDLHAELFQLVRLVPRWALALCLVPFALSMAVAWKAKERCLRRLRAGAAPPAEAKSA